MLIFADENIPFAREAFGTLGEVITFSGRTLQKRQLKDGDILLVRSVTRVTRELLEDTKIKFVATATIGTDHIDIDYLKEKGIGFANAQGSNANSVAEYVITAILFLANRFRFSLSGKTLGVIGVGNVGSVVVRMAKGLGIDVIENDPPLARRTGDSRFKDIGDVIKADIVTLHVPLYYEGIDATFHMFNEGLLSSLKKDAILINTSRGGVVETGALCKAIRQKRLLATVIDVWENEPEIDTELLRSVDIATPHIAGYSFDGKVNGTSMIYKACAEFFGLRATWRQEEVMPEPPRRNLYVETYGSDEEILWKTIQKIYDIERDSQSLRKMLYLKPQERGSYFDILRKEYPVRREFFNTTLKFSHGYRKTVIDKFASLGFNY